MPSNLNRLLIAWASSLILVVGGVLLMEATYTPPGPDAENQPVSDQNADTPDDTATAAQDQAPPTTDPSGTDAPAAATSPASDIPAPGQPPATNNQASQVSAIPQGLPIQPIQDLMEQSNDGPLPKIAADGRKSYDIYAAPRISDRSLSRIAILVTDLGKKARNTKRAIDDLPANVSLGFSVYGSNLHEWGQQARAKGHEVFLAVPMEPVNYPQNDPGPLTLLTDMSTRTNLSLLRSSLSKFSGYAGVVNYMGSRFTAAPESIRPILDELKRRGLMFIDNRDSRYSRAASQAQGINMPWAVNNGYVDDNLDAENIASQLNELEKRARAQRTALGIARSYPVTIQAIKVWAATLEERGFSLVPVTSIAGQQALPR